MKILFLGTSAGWPLPRLGCRCEICTSKDPKDTRWRPVLLIDNSVLVDCGPDIYHQLSKILNSKFEIRNLKALIITHAHPDHILGFFDITHLYNRAPELKLYLTQSTFNGLKRFYPYPLTPFKPQIIRPPENWEIDRIKFSFIPVEHDSFPTWGVKMKESKLMVYLPDIKKLPSGQKKTCTGVHLLILDGSSLGRAGQTHVHQNILEGIKLAQRLKAKQVYFTHIGHKTGKHEKLEKIVQEQGGKNFHFAFDGLELTI